MAASRAQSSLDSATPSGSTGRVMMRMRRRVMRRMMRMR